MLTTNIYTLQQHATMYDNRPWGSAIAFPGKIDRNSYNRFVKYGIVYAKFGGTSDAAFQPVSATGTFYAESDLSD